MFKVMILLKRKEEYSLREFRNWWLGEHAQLAIQLPGLKNCASIRQKMKLLCMMEWLNSGLKLKQIFLRLIKQTWAKQSQLILWPM